MRRYRGKKINGPADNDSIIATRDLLWVLSYRFWGRGAIAVLLRYDLDHRMDFLCALMSLVPGRGTTRSAPHPIKFSCSSDVADVECLSCFESCV